MLGQATLGTHHIDEARTIGQQLRQLIERAGVVKHLRYYEHLMGQIAIAEGQPSRAVACHELAISWLPCQTDIDDPHAFFYNGLAEAYNQGGNFTRALETYKKILSLTTGKLRWGDIYALSFYSMGKIYQRIGDIAAARSSYQSFLSVWEDADGGLPEVADAKKQLETLGQLPQAHAGGSIH